MGRPFGVAHRIAAQRLEAEKKRRRSAIKAQSAVALAVVVVMTAIVGLCVSTPVVPFLVAPEPMPPEVWARIANDAMGTVTPDKLLGSGEADEALDREVAIAGFTREAFDAAARCARKKIHPTSMAAALRPFAEAMREQELSTGATVAFPVEVTPDPDSTSPDAVIRRLAEALNAGPETGENDAH